MRNKKRIIFTIVMLLLLCLCPCTAMAKEVPREKKAFTILVYMIGSNLESKYSEASNDIMEMKAAMSKEQGSIGDRVNLVIEYGGSNEWSLPELADSASGFLYMYRIREIFSWKTSYWAQRLKHYLIG